MMTALGTRAASCTVSVSFADFRFLAFTFWQTHQFCRYVTSAHSGSLHFSLHTPPCLAIGLLPLIRQHSLAIVLSAERGQGLSCPLLRLRLRLGHCPAVSVPVPLAVWSVLAGHCFLCGRKLCGFWFVCLPLLAGILSIMCPLSTSVFAFVCAAISGFSAFWLCVSSWLN